MIKAMTAALLGGATFLMIPGSALAYTLSDVSGAWVCQVQSKTGEMVGDYDYTITAEGHGSMEGWVEFDDGLSNLYIEYNAEMSIRLSGEEMWETPVSANVTSAQLDFEDMTAVGIEDLRQGLLNAPTGPSYIRYTRFDELVYGDDQVLSSCVKVN